MEKLEKTLQLSNASHGAYTKNRYENFQRKTTQPVDHWAFLDEIEAPTWVDLTLECDSTYQDKDDEWFHTSHQFHQYSSRELISIFSHSGECCANSDFGLQGTCSPKLPPSVSRSRGTHCKSMELGQGKCRITSNKLHLVKNLSSKSSSMNSRSDNAIKGKLSDEKLKGHVNSMSDLVGESSLTETSARADHEPVTGFCYQETCSKSSAFSQGENNSTSTITSESTGQKSMEVCSQIFGNSSGLLSSLGLSLRKSCVTRQALRVEVKNQMSEGQTSSSSKSSVGSSSNPSSDRKNLTVRQNKEEMNSQNVTRISHAPTYKMNRSYISRAQYVQARDMICKSNRGIKLEATKAKVLVPRIVNERAPLSMAITSKKTVQADHCNKTNGGGKENVTGSLGLGMKSSRRENKADRAMSDQKVMKTRQQQKSSGKNLVGLKK
ncbi:uncharacterized protein LOC111397507 isoform X2 [Olea europaea var. sylvestris]|uniref:uncharacterized protein LOC111397507 isoform X2 n=1 Tax=Olea europaea var. sylvestris TaxID=158386 RepID=UPI000C1D417D|nr:uncharacterized protein LOC111397507 isoform X2 [Olea europaea var. sylvestris]